MSNGVIAIVLMCAVAYFHMKAGEIQLYNPSGRTAFQLRDGLTDKELFRRDVYLALKWTCIGTILGFLLAGPLGIF
jgi:hypothetical protein